MPHLNIEYTGNLHSGAGMDVLCQALAAALAQQHDGDGQPLFPLSGTRVLAYPAPFHAVADGRPQQGFIYMNLRITPGRAPALVQQAGQALVAVVSAHFDCRPQAASLAVTLHIDELSPAFEGRYRPAALPFPV